MPRRGGPEDLASSEPAVRAFLASRLHGSELEDATQTVMERALERFDVFEAADRPRAWLLGVARNVAFEVLRARARAPVPTGETDPSLDPSPSAEERLDQLEQSSLLYRALDGLRLEDQLALLMTYVDGIPGPEAAAMLGVTFAAFRQRLSRARRLAERRIRDLAESPAPVDPSAVRAWQSLLEPSGASTAAEARRAADEDSKKRSGLDPAGPRSRS